MSILYEIKNNIGLITLNNPKIHNAFDDNLIKELTHIFAKIHKDKSIRVVILKANGKHFSAGANLNWMQEKINASKAENEEDALRLARLLQTLNNLNKPTIALVQGLAMGGGAGLICCCDIVIADEQAEFSFSEVKLGLIPATIAPYVIRNIGYSAARYYFITAERFSAHTAKQIGLIHHMLTTNEDLSAKGMQIAKTISNNGPNALSTTKQLVNQLAHIDESIIIYTAKLLAKIRVSNECQEGMQAFLQKRKPNWVETDENV